MDNFKIIYKILRYLERAMDYAEPDMMPLSPEALDLTRPRWNAIWEMLAENGYVSGVTVKKYLRTETIIEISCTRITLKGLEYLHENSLMKKMADVAKGVIEVVT